MKILDKYIITEMLGPFIFGVATFTILFFAGSQLIVVSKMVAEADASFKTAFVYIINCIPTILVFTFPMAVLMAALISFGRLSGESELVAIKAGGISFLRTALPALGFSLVVSLASLYVNNYIAPNSTYIARNILARQFMKKGNPLVENVVIRDKDPDGTERVIYFKKLYPSENKMEDVTIQYYKDGRRIREVFAYEAYFKEDESKWYLKEAFIHDYGEEQEPRYTSSSKEIYFPLNKSPGQLATNRQRSPEEMNRSMLLEAMARLKKEGLKDKRSRWRYYDYNIHYHQKIAIPATCFIFGMFGIPLGVRPHRTSKAFGLGLSVVFIFVYYALMAVGMSMGQNGKLDPIWAAWMPNLVFLIAGVILLVKQARN